MRPGLHLLSVVGLAACAGASITTRVSPGTAVSIEHWTYREGRPARRLVVVNRSLAKGRKLEKGPELPISTVSDSEMALLVTRLEKLGFFEAARPTPPPKGSVLHLRIGRQDWFLGTALLDRRPETRRRWFEMVADFGRLYNLGDTAYGRAAAGGSKTFDPDAERRRLEERNRRVRARLGLGGRRR